jgi:hypothetical protein
MKQAYPLQWPVGQLRAGTAKKSKFAEHTLTSCVKELHRQVKLMDGRDPVISSNVPLRQDGNPRADYLRREISDKGVAVYFVRRGRMVCLACDKWDSVEHNLWAICKTIDNMRMLPQWGCSDILDRTMVGLGELPMIATGIDIWSILDMEATTDKEAIQARYKELAKKFFSDELKIRDLNTARDAALRMA